MEAELETATKASGRTTRHGQRGVSFAPQSSRSKPVKVDHTILKPPIMTSVTGMKQAIFALDNSTPEVLKFFCKIYLLITKLNITFNVYIQYKFTQIINTHEYTFWTLSWRPVSIPCYFVLIGFNLFWGRLICSTIIGWIHCKCVHSHLTCLCWWSLRCFLIILFLIRIKAFLTSLNAI